VGFVEWVQQLAQAAGATGLFLLSVGDSAGIPTGGGPDVLLLLQSANLDRTTAVVVLAMLATLGSTIGCLVLYVIGRRSGRVALRRFSDARVEAARNRLSQHGPWVIFLAVMAPPPYPTKLFILSAGVFGMRPIPLALSTFIGRAIRYGTGAYLGMHFGAEGLALAQQHAPWAGGVLLCLMVAAGIVIYRRHRQST
jgi:membrane protein YqaA with SNARE-associated domain